MRTAGVKATVVKAEEGGRQQPQISDSGWGERQAAGACTAACSDLDEHWIAGYYRLAGRPVMHMGMGEGEGEGEGESEGEGEAGWNGGFPIA